jgi:hypothetical protein
MSVSKILFEVNAQLRLIELIVLRKVERSIILATFSWFDCTLFFVLAKIPTCLLATEFTFTNFLVGKLSSFSPVQASHSPSTLIVKLWQLLLAVPLRTAGRKASNVSWHHLRCCGCDTSHVGPFFSASFLSPRGEDKSPPRIPRAHSGIFVYFCDAPVGMV